MRRQGPTLPWDHRVPHLETRWATHWASHSFVKWAFYTRAKGASVIRAKPLTVAAQFTNAGSHPCSETRRRCTCNRAVHQYHAGWRTGLPEDRSIRPCAKKRNPVDDGGCSGAWESARAEARGSLLARSPRLAFGAKLAARFWHGIVRGHSGDSNHDPLPLTGEFRRLGSPRPSV